MRQKTIQILSIALFVALLTWGLFSSLIWLGVPVHSTVIIDNAATESIKPLCNDNAFLCRGVYALVPLISHTLTRIPFLGWYALICLGLYVLFLGFNAFRTGSFTVQVRLTPLKLVGFWVFVLWLLFTCMSYMQGDEIPVRRVVEPLPQVYQKAGPEALANLQKNFDSLHARGCLTHVGQFGNGAQGYDLKTSCMQWSFLTRVLPMILVALVFVFQLLVAGRFFLSLLKLRTIHPLVEMMMSIGVGAGAWIILLWLVAIAGKITWPIGWGLMLIVPLVGFRHSKYWLEKFVRGAWVMQRPWHSLAIFLGWLLLSYLALNFLNVVRPFPIGWDDLGVYLNRPRLMVSYGSFIYSMAGFQWEYLTSLGFLLFGYNSDVGASSSMIINWTAGLLAVLSIYTFVSVFLGRGYGLLASLLYYMLPLVGHFSFADMKIDNAVFLTGSLAVLAVFHGLFPRDDAQTKRETLKWIGLGAAMIALSFAMKATAIMVALALGAVMLGALLHWSAFIASVLFVFGLFVKKGTLSIEDITYRFALEQGAVTELMVLGFFFGVGVLILGGAAYLRQENIKRTVVAVLVFGCVFLAGIAPWITYNNIKQGSNLLHLQFKAPNTLTPHIDLKGTSEGKTVDKSGRPIRSLSPDLVVDATDETCSPSGAKEELDRYWGYSKGWGHYLTLPWRTVMNVDSAGYYVTTMSVLLLFPLLLLVPFFWIRQSRWVRWLFAGTLLMLLQWMFLGNGIPWYGIGTFLGLVVGLEVLFAKSPDIFGRSVVTFLIAVSMFGALGMRFWQFEQQRNLFEYVLGKVSAQAMRERTIPHYDDIAEIVVELNESNPGRPYLYRVGTFIPYFIPKNLEIIGISDHQLDVFNCIHQERDPALTTRRLKELGFNSIVFDTNTATIERDQNGSLHKKVQAFVDYLNSGESGLQLVINDPSAGVTFLLIP